MEKAKEYAFVLDAEEKQLSPMRAEKAWYQIRKGCASLVSLYPLVVRLKKTIPTEEICKDEIRLGIDDGSKHVGIALVQKCQTKNKVVFKGTLEHRNDVHKLMEIRKGYRRYHRYHKRYRKARFNNRASSHRKGRLAPSIRQKKQAVLRVVKRLSYWIKIDSCYLEDVAIDIRALTDGYRPYKWQYQKSNRLDENIRKAVILRDNCKCMECGKTDSMIEVHHIRPRRMNGSNTMGNLISLCPTCHDKTEGREELFMQRYFNMLKGFDNRSLNHAEYVMQGKQYLRSGLKGYGTLHLTTGGNTANRRIGAFQSHMQTMRYVLQD